MSTSEAMLKNVFANVEGKGNDVISVPAFNKELRKFNDKKALSSFRYLEHLGPCHALFYYPLNPIFLFEIHDLKFLKQSSFFMVRDGVYTLLDFFHRNPDPRDLQTTLLIHESLIPLVPEKWQGLVLQYRYTLIKNKQLEKKSDERIVLKGIACKSSFDIDHMEEIARRINERKYKKVIASVSVKDDAFMPKYFRREDTYFDFFKTLFKKIDADIEFVNWPDLCTGFAPYPELEFFDLNQNFAYCADDFTSNFLISKGCTPAMSEKRSLKKSEHLIEVSPFHGLVISSVEKFEHTLSSEIASMQKKLVKEEKNLCDGSFGYYAHEIAHRRLNSGPWPTL